MLLLALLAAGWSSPAFAGSPAPAAVTAVCGVDQAGAGVPLMASWLDSVTGVFEGMTGNKTRVIQFTMIAMLLALWIIWWRK